MLAGTDRLDKELMIGQMQGKFQMVVLPASGHCVTPLTPLPFTQSFRFFFHQCSLSDPTPVPPPPPPSPRLAPQVMEDQPDLTAKTLSDFASRCYAPHPTAQRAAALKYFLRYRFGELILVKGVVAHLPGAAGVARPLN